MGAWSHEAFSNDDALDWVHGLEAVDDLSLIEAALQAVLDDADAYLEAPQASEALAAIELIARLRGQAGDEACPEMAEDWVARVRLLPPEPLVQRALAALDRIGAGDSELKELWDDSDSAEAWQASLAQLRRRLQAPPLPLPEPLDAMTRLVRRVAGLSFEVPDLPSVTVADGPFAGMLMPQLYATVLAAEALGDRATVREGIARIWHSVEAAGRVNVLWDLALREAKTWAAEGRLAQALAGLAPWRESAEALDPGSFDMRLMAVYQVAGAHEEAERLRERLIAAGHGAVMQLIDLALREARAGSVQAAQALIAAHATSFQADAIQPWLAFTQGILAVRQGRPEALDLLTPWIEARVALCPTQQAIWGFFGLGVGWWALALQRAGREADARAVIAAVRPLLLTPDNVLLVNELRSAGLLAADEVSPSLPLPPLPGADFADTEVDHGAFRSVGVRGVNALKQLEAWRREFEAGSGRYPFLIGDAADLEALLQSIEPPADGGHAILAAAAAVDAGAWLGGRAPAKLPRWRSSDAEPCTLLNTPFETSSGRLKPLIHIGLVELDEPAELFARLGYGGWNDCPEAAIHVALHRHWRERFGAEPVAVSGDEVECHVARPPDDRKAALALAAEQQAYCSDIVEQNAGSVAALAATLLDAAVWYFWWD